MCPPDELSAQNTALLKRRRRSPNANSYYNSSAWEPVPYVLEKPGRHLLKRKVESMAFLWLANIPNGTIIPKQPVKHLPTRDSSGRVREKLKYCKKCQKWLLKQARKCMCHCVGHLLRQTITSARGHSWTELSGLNLSIKNTFGHILLVGIILIAVRNPNIWEKNKSFYLHTYLDDGVTRIFWLAALPLRHSFIIICNTKFRNVLLNVVQHQVNSRRDKLDIK